MRKSFIAVVAAAVLLVPVALSAQTTASSDVTVQAVVERGLTMTPATATLNFGTVVAGAGAPTIAPASGVAFTISGQTSKAIHFTFGAGDLVDAASNHLAFTPDVIGGTANDATVATTITSGAGLALSAADPGAFYAWVGGSLAVTSTTPPGTYSGTWTLQVAY